MEGLLWVAHGDEYGRPVVTEGSLGHSPDVRFCGRTNYDRYGGKLLFGDFDGMFTLQLPNNSTNF